MPFNGPLSRTTQVSRIWKGKTNLDLLEQETVSSSCNSWARRKSAPHIGTSVSGDQLHHGSSSYHVTAL